MRLTSGAVWSLQDDYSYRPDYAAHIRIGYDRKKLIDAWEEACCHEKAKNQAGGDKGSQECRESRPCYKVGAGNKDLTVHYDVIQDLG